MMSLAKSYSIACEGPYLRPEFRTPAQVCVRNSNAPKDTAAAARRAALRNGWQRVGLQVTEYSRRRVDLCPACAQVLDARADRARRGVTNETNPYD